MLETSNIPNGNVGAGDAPQASSSVKKSKKLTVEKIYQKKSQLEHILLRPDTYIGSVERIIEQQWVYNEETNAMEKKELSYVPGLYKIFDEILVNAADNKQRDPKMNSIKISIDKERNIISIYNNGQGIPVVTHKDEKMYVPTMIFGHLLTSSNYDDEEQKVTGGRNGYGAKLCNIFSTEFSVETASGEYGKAFKQTWKNNMAEAGEPRVKDFSGKDYTKVIFSPDLGKFKMENLEQDIIDLMIRRAFDVAASTGVFVYLNDKKLPVHNFTEYVNLFIPKTDDAPKVIFDKVSDRWEVALTLSDSGFQQMSFVNSIATTKGGRHVDNVADSIAKSVLEKANKKHKGGPIKPFQVKNHMWLFINCLIVNPSFDSQTKENMTTQPKSFGSKCVLSEKFFKSVDKNLGLVETVVNWAKFKEEAKMVRTSAKKKTMKLMGIPKLEDANWAGGKNSLACTLILTEGDSAKTLAVAGLGVIGRDKYGVFPLRGKLLNVREASSKQVMDNAEINNVIKILGLQYKKKYESVDDLKSLRYGKLMIMTDQDQDGSHIKGLLINFIHYNWPTLLRLPFLEEFITPIVKASKGKEVKSFFSLPEFEEWKAETDNWHTYKIKYYKGLGTSTSNEAKEYFRDMQRHRIKFIYSGPNDDSNISMAFSKKLVEQRKEWLTQWMETVRQRREMGLPEDYLYEKDTSQVNYSDFVNKELVLFSNSDNERSIPSMMDGFKPGQRKVLYTCFKRNDKKEVKVAQLAGSVAEHSAYHHGEVSLMSTIVNLAQNFVGSNNINVLQPIGQFGTRLGGGKDQASPRYIFTMLSPLARLLFPTSDDPLLTSQYDDNQKIEPVFYAPIIPMVLVNGAEGIGTAWSTKIPNHNPRDLVKNLLKMLDGEEPTPMIPWYKNFRGTIEPCSQTQSRYVCFGEIATLDESTLEITELPIGTWTDSYKCVLEGMVGDGKTGTILDYKEHNTDVTVRFVVELSRDKLEKALDEGLHKFFKLQTYINTTSMVLFDDNGCLKKFDTVISILKEFFTVRLEYYVKRKSYMEGVLQAECRKLSNQARFILEKCNGELTIENKKRVAMVQELEKRGFDSDPVRLWKLSQNKDEALVEENENSDNEEEESEAVSKKKYDYLLSMPLWSLTLEKKNELLKKRDEKLQEYDLLKKKTSESLWRDDLEAFLEKLEEVERKEREDMEPSTSKGRKAGVKATKAETEPEPSKYGTRVIPKLDADSVKKLEKAEKPKVKRVKKAEVGEEDRDEFDELGDKPIKSLKDRLGNSPEAIEKKLQAKRKTLKQSQLPFTKKKKGTSFDSDEDASGSDLSDSAEKKFVTPPERSSSRRAAASKVRYNFSDESGASHDEDMEEGENGTECFFNSTTSKVSGETREKTSPPVEEDAVIISGTDSEFEPDPPAPKFAGGSEAMFDSLLSGDSPIVERVVEKKAPAKKPASAEKKKQPPKRAKKKDDSDSDDMFSKITTKKGRKNPFEDDWTPAKLDGGDGEKGVSRTGRKRSVAKYTMDSDDEDDDDF